MARRAHVRPVVSRFVLLALAAAPAGTGCQFQPDSLSGNPGTRPDAMTVPPDAPPPPPDDAPRPIDAPLAIDATPPPDTGPAPDAAPLPEPDVLVDRGLLTRYFIDEATDGQAPAALEDSAPDPLDLTIIYAESGSFVDTDNNRGLRWAAITEDGKAAAPLPEDSKVWLGLDGSGTGTMEVVVDVDQIVDGSRLSHIGETEDSGVFTLRLDLEEGVVFAWNNDDGGRVTWNLDLTTLDRTVLHLVLDTGRNSASERVRLYVDGVERPSFGGTPPARDEAIDLVTGSPNVYAIGNKESGERGLAGTFFYVSMYSTALSQDEVEHNFAILDVNDDGPGL